jgi:hypothetical protein
MIETYGDKKSDAELLTRHFVLSVHKSLFPNVVADVDKKWTFVTV